VALVLSVSNVERLDNGVSTRMRLDRHGVVIGRSPTVDWSLPDPSNTISSIHCAIEFRDEAYVLIDKSRNGTYVNESLQRMTEPYRLQSGDTITIGHYRIVANLDDGRVDVPPPPAPAWSGWGGEESAPAEQEAGADGWGPSSAQPYAPPSAPVSPGASDWGAEPAPAASSDWGAAPAPAAFAPAPAPGWGPPSEPAPAADPLSSNWTPLAIAQPAAEASVWSSPEAPAVAASDWSSPVAATPTAPTADDIWGRMEASNVVDWSRGFSAPAPASTGPDPLGLAPATQADPLGLAAPATPLAGQRAPAPPSSGWTAAPAPLAQTPAAPTQRPAPSTWTAPPAGASPAPAVRPGPTAAPPLPSPAAAAPSTSAAEWRAFITAAGLAPSDVKRSPAETLSAAGAVLRRLVGGVVVMLEARARAKQQLGAQGTVFDRNPLKVARTPEQALAQLLSGETGMMSPERAIEAAFQDLQAHQMAQLAAMQGALRATLDRFAPGAIRNRAEAKGLLARILPGAHEAALWRAYEREFEGVARGSDEAFMDVFAKEFRQAYERASEQLRRGR